MLMIHTIPQPQQQQLLAVARSTIRAAIAKSPPSTSELPKITGEYGGAFVTLWVTGELRGCVGYFATTNDLVSTVRALTISSWQDQRFAGRRVTVGELDQLVIEISLLSLLTRIDTPRSIVIGKHGIVVRKGKQQGCFLPKVAVERGWDAETFLTQACSMKANLPPQAWHEKETDIFTFTAQVFSESQAFESDNP